MTQKVKANWLSVIRIVVIVIACVVSVMVAHNQMVHEDFKTINVKFDDVDESIQANGLRLSQHTGNMGVHLNNDFRESMTTQIKLIRDDIKELRDDLKRHNNQR